MYETSELDRLLVNSAQITKNTHLQQLYAFFYFVVQKEIKLAKLFSKSLLFMCRLCANIDSMGVIVDCLVDHKKHCC